MRKIELYKGSVEPFIITMPTIEGYYVEDGVIYRCTRNSEVALSHNLSALLGIYVEEVK